VAASSFTYELIIENTGPDDAVDLVVVDTLPPDVSYVSATGLGWNCNHANGDVTCTRGSLSAGFSSGVSIDVVLPLVPGSLTNVATVSSRTPDISQSNNADSQLIIVEPVPDSSNLDLGAPAFDMEFDDARQLLYVSVPSLGSIEIISLDNFNITQSVSLGNSPHGLDLSTDGSMLYAALNQNGSVAAIDLNTLMVIEIDVSTELNTLLTHDVIAPTPNEVFVSGDPYSSGIAYIVRIDTGSGNLASRVASNSIIRADPVFAARSNPQFLYVGEGFSPNSVYKLDLNQADVPLVLEDSHGSIGNSGHLAVSQDGSMLFLKGGQVLNTATLSEIGQIGTGVSIVSNDGNSVLVGDAPNRITVYDIATLQLVDTLYTACNMNGIDRIVEVSPGVDWILLGQQTVCRVNDN
jgi:DNA-binding beta-propeller fold protein YncE